MITPIILTNFVFIAGLLMSILKMKLLSIYLMNYLVVEEYVVVVVASKVLLLVALKRVVARVSISLVQS